MAEAKTGSPAQAFQEAPKDKAPRDRTSKNFDKNAAITLKVEANPKRAGSKSHARFEHYKTSKTVGDFITKGGTYGDLAWDSARGFITIAGHTPKLVEKKAKAEKKPEAPTGASPVKGQPATGAAAAK